MVKVGILKLLLPGGYSILLPILFFQKDDKLKWAVAFPWSFEYPF